MRPPMPPYRRIADDLRRRIETGRLLPGEQIPPVPALMEEFKVSRNTVLRALKLLQDDGLIYVERGWGSFVKDRSAES